MSSIRRPKLIQNDTFLSGGVELPGIPTSEVLTLTGSAIAKNVGDADFAATYTVVDANGVTRTGMKLRSSDRKVIRVNADGTLRVMGGGSCTLELDSGAGSGTIAVTITGAAFTGEDPDNGTFLYNGRPFGAGSGGSTGFSFPGEGDPLFANMKASIEATLATTMQTWWEQDSGLVGTTGALTSWTDRVGGAVLAPDGAHASSVQAKAMRGVAKTTTPIALDHTTKGYLIVAAIDAQGARGAAVGSSIATIEKNDSGSAGGHPSRKLSLQLNGGFYGDGAGGVAPTHGTSTDKPRVFAWYVRSNSVQGAGVNTYDDAVAGTTSMSAALPNSTYHVYLGEFAFGDYSITDFNNLDNQFFGIIPVPAAATDAAVKTAIERVRTYWRAKYTPAKHTLKVVKIYGDSKSQSGSLSGDWVSKSQTALGANYLLQNYALGGYRLEDLATDRDAVNDTVAGFDETLGIDYVERQNFRDLTYHDPLATYPPLHYIDLGVNDGQNEAMTQAIYTPRYTHYANRRMAHGAPAARITFAHMTALDSTAYAGVIPRKAAAEAACDAVTASLALAARPGTSTHMHPQGTADPATGNTYFQDGIHFTDAGGTEMATVVAVPYISGFAW